MKPVDTGMKDISKGDIHDYDKILNYFNNRLVKQDYKENYKSITFVTTGIIPYDGGQTTMLHLGTLLSLKGYQVYYLSYVPQSTKNMQINAEFNYPGYQGQCLAMKSLKSHHSDIWIATLWESAYIIKNFSGYKMYFVQDYEPYFYPYGDRYHLAKRTYELGLHMVSLGPWCAKQIKTNCQLKSPLDTINFPVEDKDYPYQKRNFSSYPTKKEIKLAVYTKFSSSRRAPINIQITLYNCQKLLKSYGLTLKINYFGTPQDKQFINGQNLGRLNKKQLNTLYQDSDFGIAPSMTNFSLVPFEMMSTGLPFIDFIEGTGNLFVPKNCCFYTQFNEFEVAKILRQALKNVQQLFQMTANVKKYLSQISWQKTEDNFLKVLQHINQ